MIALKNVSKIYESKETKTTALNKVSVKINAGEIFGVIGLSGAGKSTLLRTVNYLEKPTEGDVIVDERNLAALSVRELRTLRKNIGMIFQHFNLLESKTIYQNVAIPLILNKTKKSMIDKRVTELLSFVGLEDKAERYPNELSGGQKQRVGIARALATNPSILLCDEATSALDPETTNSILQLLKKINETYRITILIITHEMEIVEEICDRVAVMHAGEIVECDTVVNLFSNPQHEMTKRFIGEKPSEKLPEMVRENIAAIKEGKVLKLIHRKEVNELLNEFIKEEHITVHFLHSFVSKDRRKCESYMIVHVKGDAESVATMLEQLRNKQYLLEEVV